MGNGHFCLESEKKQNKVDISVTLNQERGIGEFDFHEAWN